MKRTKLGLYLLLAGLLLFTELTFNLLYRSFGQVWHAVVIHMLTLYACKIGGDLACRLLGRSNGAWRYLTDYAIDELFYFWTPIVVFLSSVSSYISSNMCVPGSLAWRLSLTSLPAVILFGLRQSKWEGQERENARLGRRARIKYGMP